MSAPESGLRLGAVAAPGLARERTHRPSRHWWLLGGLAALWGTAFLFVDVAVRELSPARLVSARLVTAADGNRRAAARPVARVG